MASEEQRPVDAFILFNEREERVPSVADRLEAAGVSTYFWRRDIEVGEDFVKTEDEFIQSAKSIVVFLGSAGWGPTQSSLAKRAQELQRRILPVLIGDPPPAALAENGGLFSRFRYVDLRTDSSKEFDLLVRSIKSDQLTSETDPSFDASRFDGFIQTIVDGDESDRLATLQQVLSLPILDRMALGTRLRLEIQTRYGVESETTFSSSPRPPKRIASIRSWLLSCLISADCESSESQSLIQSYLSVSKEPDASVRYWVLAQLYVVRASYLLAAAESALNDNAGEIRLMARAILSPDDLDFLAECRARLAGPTFETAWTVLRVLRAIPIPSLAADVCVQLQRSEVGTPLSYDSLSALCSRPMAQAAAPVLTENPGVEPTINRVIGEAGLADKVAAGRFVWFLTAFPIQIIRSIIEAARSVPSSRRGAELLLDALLRTPGGQLENISISGYSNDSNDVDHDYLDIREDVQTLAAVMLARDVKPPLAIGLFGDWGTGKSFFMDSLRATTQKLADLKVPHICSDIVSISFNAWHYADTNLWASMVNFILERLSAYISPQPSLQEQEESFIGQLASAKAVVEAAEDEKRTTEALINTRAVELENAKRDREQKEIRLRDLKAEDFQKILEDDPALKKSLKEAMKQMGIPELLASEAQLSAVTSDAVTLTTRISAIATSIATSGNIWIVLSLLIFVLVGVPWLGDFIRNRVVNGVFVGVGVAVTQIASTLMVGARIFGSAVHKIRNSVTVISQAKDKIDKLLAEKRSHESDTELNLQSEIAALRAKEAESSARLKAATTRVAELEDRIAATKRGRSLAQFLTERTKSDDYRKYLGLISVVRQDFDTLAERLQAPTEAVGASKPVDRIVLYIDDLDRCPEEKVLEVLQAVHLLLAYPIFVVVVGVDPRWLTHSLKHSFRALRRARTAMNADELIQATPQNYLEKIFQIPFSLRPMSSAGYSKLIGSLFMPEGSASPLQGGQAEKPATLTDDRTEVPEGSKEATFTRRSGETGQDPAASKDENEPEQNPVAKRPESDSTIIVGREALLIKPWEATFATRLFPLIPTPRSAKRFSNIYRLLKASVQKGRLSAFEGTEGLLGEFQVPMTLLAIVIGSPDAARTLFPSLLAAAQGSRSPLEMLRYAQWEDDDNREVPVLLRKLKPIVSNKIFPAGPAVYEFWIPRVSRFSFDLVQALAADQDDSNKYLKLLGN